MCGSISPSLPPFGKWADLALEDSPEASMLRGTGRVGRLHWFAACASAAGELTTIDPITLRRCAPPPAIRPPAKTARGNPMPASQGTASQRFPHRQVEPWVILPREPALTPLYRDFAAKWSKTPGFSSDYREKRNMGRMGGASGSLDSLDQSLRTPSAQPRSLWDDRAALGPRCRGGRIIGNRAPPGQSRGRKRSHGHPEATEERPLWCAGLKARESRDPRLVQQCRVTQPATRPIAGCAGPPVSTSWPGPCA